MKYISCLFLLLPTLLLAQSYDAALGLRVGTDMGVSAQLRMPLVHKNFTTEAIIQSSLARDEGQITLLGKQHHPILSRRLNLFMGGGVHFGWSNELEGEQSAKGPTGLTGIIGGEATFGKINVSYDFKPAINISGGDRVLYTQTAVSVRYVIAKRHSIFDRQGEKERSKRRKKRKRDKRRAERGKRWYEVWKKADN
ncbi:MAG: hypothetical protein AAF828_10175 [Bacteroidota bacterium]